MDTSIVEQQRHDFSWELQATTALEKEGSPTIKELLRDPRVRLPQR